MNTILNFIINTIIAYTTLSIYAKYTGEDSLWILVVVGAIGIFIIRGFLHSLGLLKYG